MMTNGYNRIACERELGPTCFLFPNMNYQVFMDFRDKYWNVVFDHVSFEEYPRQTAYGDEYSDFLFPRHMFDDIGEWLLLRRIRLSGRCIVKNVAVQWRECDNATGIRPVDWLNENDVPVVFCGDLNFIPDAMDEVCYIADVAGKL